MIEKEFFTEYGEANRYQIREVIGKGSYGVVASATDTQTGEMVAIKKINDVFEHTSDATRILREVKLLRLLHHPNIVQIRHIMLPPSRREFKDIYVVFELLESDLHQVIKANNDLTPEHHQYFLYQLLRGLRYIHAANVYHRDLKPKNILANADCKVKICDFGLARVSFDDTPSTVFWTDYVATRWYRKPLFPGKNVVHQLDIMTDLLGTPPPECISRIRNDKARRYLSNMREKIAVPFSQKFPNVDPRALSLLQRLLAFDPRDRPTAEEALSDSYFYGFTRAEKEASPQPISRFEFAFEKKKLRREDVRELIYKEILEYHPKMLRDYLDGSSQTNFLYPSGVDRFKQQFAHLEDHKKKGEKASPLQRKQVSMPRERLDVLRNEAVDRNEAEASQKGANKLSAEKKETSLRKSDSISASQSIAIRDHNKEIIHGHERRALTTAVFCGCQSSSHPMIPSFGLGSLVERAVAGDIEIGIAEPIAQTEPARRLHRHSDLWLEEFGPIVSAVCSTEKPVELGTVETVRFREAR
ncbi:hypothetical protein V2J09_001691 [Rumex salicifolius]